jgi:hypothetical protein
MENARHDIFHEEAIGVAETVRHCIIDWILSLNPKGTV